MIKFSVPFILNSIALLFVIDVVFALSHVDSILTVSSILGLILMFFLFVGLINNPALTNKDFTFLSLFVVISFMHFLNAPISDVQTYLKLLGPIIFFYTGYSINTTGFFSRPRKIYKRNIIYVICFLPPLVRIFQIVTGDVNGLFSVFVNSNNFAYYIFVSGALIYFLTGNKKYFLFYTIFCFMLSKTLGAVLALSISTFVFYRKDIVKVKGLLLISIIATIFISLVAYSDIAVFTRIRDSLTTFKQLQSAYSLSSFQNIGYDDASQYVTGGTEDLSFLFRIKNWAEIAIPLVNSDFFDIMFGHGLMTVPKITSTGLVAHNDYLGLMYEMGLAYFLLVVVSYFKILKRLGKHFESIPFIAIAIYHFTENLYYNFVVTSLSFFLIGAFYSGYYKFKPKDENIADKQISL